MVQHVLVLGGGSAGLIAALSLKTRMPRLAVRVLRSADIGIIGVGEGTTQQFPRYFFTRLGLPPGPFYAETQPTWKLGLRFLWGPRPQFFYTFSAAFDDRRPELPKNHGFYCGDGELPATDLWSACARHDRALPRLAEGGPWFNNHANLAFHIENARLVAYLEARCRERGVDFTDATVREVEVGDGNELGKRITALHLDAGEKITADLIVDASGFRSELLGRALGEPFCDYANALFCDRAVIGGWPRTDEPIRPYTLAETMDAGWCWQIEHEHFINRGYVHASPFISDGDALAELVRKNPRISPEKTRVVKFRSGRYARAWVGNVVGIGNAAGFVEPLEATALGAINLASGALADTLLDCNGEPTRSAVTVYNRFVTETSDEIRDFLAIHYRFNTRLHTPFWQHCRTESPLGGAAPIVEFYEENGPSALAKNVLLTQNNTFGLEGYLALLIGQAVPHAAGHTPSTAEAEAWRRHLAAVDEVGRNAFTVAEGLAFIRDPRWKW